MVISSAARVARYSPLEARHAQRAMAFFEQRAHRSPHLSFMEDTFLRALHFAKQMADSGQTSFCKPANQIEPISFSSPHLAQQSSFGGKKEERFRQRGMEALQKGELAIVDLAGGMATGFGGGAKGSVLAQVDARYEGKTGITYLDIKRANYLQYQREYGRHLIAAAFVSNETRGDIVKNLTAFAENHEVELVLIEDGESRENVQAIWEKYRNRPYDSIIVPILMQPSTLYISKDARLVGSRYMGGHGDFYGVVQAQMKSIVEVMGIKYIFVHNIDNTGALLSRSILGYFAETAESERVEALVEVAEKFEGDKGGAPSLVDSRFSILEGAFVPPELKDDFLGRAKFPFFNTNSFWFLARALFDRQFTLPLMISKVIREKNADFLKIETIIGQGLDHMVARALVIDRGMRFCPAKFISDLWTGRTNWIRTFNGRLMPVMRDGEYVPKPLVELGKAVFGSVKDIDSRLFGHGSYDEMVDLKTLVIGGEGKRFHDVGQIISKCGVCYRGDVGVIFEYREGQPSGTLIIQGASEADTITLEDCVLYVPAGSTRVIDRSVNNRVEVTREDYAAFLANTLDRWPESQRQRVLSELFPEFRFNHRIITLEDLLAGPLLIDDIHQGELRKLNKYFVTEGSFGYEVVEEENPDVRKDPEKARLSQNGLWPKLHVIPGSKTGLAALYPSRVDTEWGWATDHKATTILKMPHEIYIDPINARPVPEGGKGEIFQGKYYIAIPYGLDGRGRIIMIIGHFNEEYNPQEKLVEFDHKLKSLLNRYADPNRDLPREVADRIRARFVQIPWAHLHTKNSQVLFEEYKFSEIKAS